MTVQEMRLDQIKPYRNNPRKNDEAVQAVANSIREFGFKQPIVVDADGVIIVGHTRYKAAQELGLETVPVLVADDLSDDKVKAYRLADNKTNELAEWDLSALETELAQIDMDMSGFGFDSIIQYDSNDDSDKDIEFQEKLQVIVELQTDQEAEELFTRLSKEGYQCRISTL